MTILSKSDGSWHNPPPQFSFDASGLRVTTGHKTDFWRDTYYGFQRDSGHFLALSAPERFTAVLTFEADYQHLYDQAGLMLRIDEKRWLKLGIEHSDGVTNFSIVVTVGQSDWSVVAQPLVSGAQQVRLTRLEGCIIAHYRASDGSWRLMRVAPFPGDAGAQLGPTACSPEREGLQVRFIDLSVDEPLENPLH